MESVSMITVKEDKSYMSKLDLTAIDNGFAEMGIHSLKITNFYTDEQKQANSKIFDTLTREQWNERCDQIKQIIGDKVEKIVDTIHEKFMIYQYKNKDINFGKDDWDLFFWHNTGDMSYVTLNPNTKRSNSQQLIDIENVLSLLKEMNVEGIQVTIQYTTIYNDEKVQNAAIEYCNKVKDTFINYGGYIGKIVEFNGRYVFRKKGAKKNAYEINNNTVLRNVLAQ